MLTLFIGPGDRAAHAARLRRIERKLDLILDHLGLDGEDPAAASLPAEARRLADDGRKIEAIKAYREQTGAGLREAKEAIEAYLAGR